MFDFLGVETMCKHTSDDVETYGEAPQSILEKHCRFLSFFGQVNFDLIFLSKKLFFL